MPGNASIYHTGTWYDINRVQYLVYRSRVFCTCIISWGHQVYRCTYVCIVVVAGLTLTHPEI